MLLVLVFNLSILRFDLIRLGFCLLVLNVHSRLLVLLRLSLWKMAPPVEVVQLAHVEAVADRVVLVPIIRKHLREVLVVEHLICEDAVGNVLLEVVQASQILHPLLLSPLCIDDCLQLPKDRLQSAEVFLVAGLHPPSR